jgi:hypothetical protein
VAASGDLIKRCSAFGFARAATQGAPFERCPREATHGQYCVFHAPRKNRQLFQTELDQLLNQGRALDVSEFVFPAGVPLVVPDHIVSVRARSADFGGPVVLANRTYSGLVYFRGSHFRRGLAAADSHFQGVANFQDCAFERHADFHGAEFTGRSAYFFGSRFSTYADFGGVRCDAEFNAQWVGANTIDFGRASFSEAFKAFGMEAYEHAGFDYADFRGRVLAENMYLCSASFMNTCFSAPAWIGFDEEPAAALSDPPTWEASHRIRASVAEYARDSKHLRAITEDEYWQCRQLTYLSYSPADQAVPDDWPRISFSGVRPGTALNISGDLTGASFVNTDLSLVDTTNAVWPHCRGLLPTGKERTALYDECLLRRTLRMGAHTAWSEPKEIAASYRALRKQYESRLAYHEASDFHIGEMEMRRLSGYVQALDHGTATLRCRDRWRRLRALFRRYFSVTAIYSYLSRYGESYRRPLVWATVALLAFAWAFKSIGLGNHRSGVSPPGTSPTTWPDALAASLAAIAWRSLPTDSGADPFVRILMVAETVTGAVLVALLVLALRRHFRR